MRIAIMSREYPPETGWGGIGTYKFHLAYGLKALGHDVEVFSLSADSSPKTVIKDGITVHRSPVHDHPHGEQLIRECSNDALSEIHKCMPHARYVLNAGLAMWRTFDEVHSRQPFDVIDAPELFADSLFVGARRNVAHVIRLLTPHAKFIADTSWSPCSNGSPCILAT
jgi:glycosyltransferase involved in cell wall biosynthesis